MESIDRHVFKQAMLNYFTYNEMMKNLLAFKNAGNYNDFASARLIFRWLTVKKMDTLKFSKKYDQLKESPEHQLMIFSKVNSSYASIFSIMCEYANIECVVVEGWAKGGDHLPGDSFLKDKYNHTWNLVKLCNDWYIIDVRWASRFVQSSNCASSKRIIGEGDSETFVYLHDDYYFLADPQKFIYSHFPANPYYQLLNEPQSFEWFTDLPNVKSYFFKMGISFSNLSNKAVVPVELDNGTAILSFFHNNNGAFHYKINPLSNSNATNMEPYVLMEQLSNRIYVYIRSPKAYKYLFTLFAQISVSSMKKNRNGNIVATVDELSSEIEIKNANPKPKDLSNNINTFRAVSEHVIDASQINWKSNAQPFPECIYTVWGNQSEEMDKFNLISQQLQAVGFVYEGDSVVYPFTRKNPEIFDKNIKLHVRIVYGNDYNKQYFDNCAFIYKFRNSFVIVIRPPTFSQLSTPNQQQAISNKSILEYGIEFYARMIEPQSVNSKSDPFVAICQYLVVVSPVQSNCSLPVFQNNSQYSKMDHGLFLNYHDAIQVFNKIVGCNILLKIKQLCSQYFNRNENESTFLESTTLSSLNTLEIDQFKNDQTFSNPKDISSVVHINNDVKGNFF
ncbi:hypothetical protein A3Q56_07836 [Intoshia linei]|uniref:Transglutaminase-like domain-containing protein n=1 Tax=Intoshia linei TaxID=1819745 RepID=A0A177AR20_9BILA|nr:hypothetical protein A3Q56_07836 [Intoshia linei]